MISPEIQQIIVGPNGPQVVVTPAKTITISGGYLETEDQKIIDRIRSDQQFNTEEITELTKDDEEIINIRKSKEKEAEVEIKARKKK